LAVLNQRDEIKIVIASRADYEWARDVLRERQLDQLCQVLFSPAQGQIEAADLASWILEDGLPVRFQMQLHKLLWGNMRGK
jgi:7-carboxy-7-deazaguanine synthase